MLQIGFVAPTVRNLVQKQATVDGGDLKKISDLSE